MSTTRRYLSEPAGSSLDVLVVTDPPGSATVVLQLAVDGNAGPSQPASAGIMSFPCPQGNTTYIVGVDMSWIATGHVIISSWLNQPGGNKVLRTPIILLGQNGAVERATIQVLTV